MNVDLTYDQAREHIEEVLIRGPFTKSEVLLVRAGDRRYVVKDYSSKGFWERNLIGRVVIGRETRAYQALHGVAGVPDGFKRLSPFALAVEYVEGPHLGGLGPDAVGPETIQRLATIIETLHARGWVHLDLHRRTNILLTPGGDITVVDLASALHPGAVPLIGRMLTRLLGLADRLSLIKMKTIFAPRLLTAREQKVIALRNRISRTKWKLPPR